MKKQTNRIAYRLCISLGVVLLVVAAVALISWQWGIRTSQEKAAGYVQTILARIPAPQSAVPEERGNNTLPVLSVDGVDFVGVLEMPRYSSKLPVAANWGKVSEYPCLFDGSVYDRTLQIGATTQKGQYDFYRDISVGDAISFTDMEGNRFCYTVADIRYEKHADQAALLQKDAALTLFIKNVYDLEYIVIFCDVLH